jgi:DNA invertase Pin-like site-specific DNA recombinase
VALIADYCDVMTGRRHDRREYQRMLRHVPAREVDVVVVQFLNRLRREASDGWR